MGKLNELLRRIGRHKARGMPLVRTSDGHLVLWNKRYIVRQLLRETKLAKEFFGIKAISRPEAEEIASIVEERIRKLDLKFVSAPLIREIVNNVLLELSERNPAFVIYRNLCTRCGIPVYDAYTLLHLPRLSGHRVNSPDAIYRQLAYSSSREMALLLMPPHLADAHLKGDIHIHQLEHFLTRPLGIALDIRYLFLHGLMLTSRIRPFRPARRPEDAILQVAKAITYGSTHVALSEVILPITIFLAPFFKGVSPRGIRRYMRLFILEVMHAYITRGDPSLKISLQISPYVPAPWSSKHVVYKGVIQDELYEDYEEEARTIFLAMLHSHINICNLRPLSLCLTLLVHDDSVREYMKLKESILRLLSTEGEIHVERFPANVVGCHHAYDYPTIYMENELHKVADLENNFANFGLNQVVSVNLPRLAYKAKGSDEKLMELMRRAIEVAFEVFTVKQRWLKKAIANKLLPLLRQKIKGRPLWDLNCFNYVVGLVGLRDMILYHTGLHPSVDHSSRKLLVNLLSETRDFIQELSERQQMSISLVETKDEGICRRLAIADMLSPTYRYCAKKVVSGDVDRVARLLKRGSRDLPITYSNRKLLMIRSSLKTSLELENDIASYLDGHTVCVVVRDPNELSYLFKYLASESKITHLTLIKGFAGR